MIAASLLNPMRDALRKISGRTFKDSKRSHDFKVKKLEPMIIILLSLCLTVVPLRGADETHPSFATTPSTK
jgi:hypothetical protein